MPMNGSSTPGNLDNLLSSRKEESVGTKKRFKGFVPNLDEKGVAVLYFSGFSIKEEV